MFLPPDCVLVEQVIPKFPSRSEYAVKRFRPEILVNLLSDAEGYAVAIAEFTKYQYRLFSVITAACFCSSMV